MHVFQHQELLECLADLDEIRETSQPVAMTRGDDANLTDDLWMSASAKRPSVVWHERPLADLDSLVHHRELQSAGLPRSGRSYEYLGLDLQEIRTWFRMKKSAIAGD